MEYREVLAAHGFERSYVYIKSYWWVRQHIPPAYALIEIDWFLVMVIVVPFLSLVVHLPDAWVGVLGGASRTASSIIYGCVTSPDLSWLMWMGKVGTDYCIST